MLPLLLSGRKGWDAPSLAVHRLHPWRDCPHTIAKHGGWPSLSLAQQEHHHLRPVSQVSKCQDVQQLELPWVCLLRTPKDLWFGGCEYEEGGLGVTPGTREAGGV